MGISKFPAALIFAVVVVVMTVTSRVAEAQTPSCLSSLTPCAAYLSTTGTPPASCCTPLKDAVTNQFQCLCNLYANPSVLQNLGINVTQAMALPARCNIATGSCSTAPTPTPTPTSSMPPPPPPLGPALVVVTVTVTSAEVQATSCASSLAPCANYTNGTGTPPASCCTPLKEALNDIVLFQCLCNLYANITQATDLPSRCQIYLFCPSASAPTSTSSVLSPPRTPGTILPPPGVGRIAWAGLPSLLFFWASMMLY